MKYSNFAAAAAYVSETQFNYQQQHMKRDPIYLSAAAYEKEPNIAAAAYVREPQFSNY